MSAIDNYQRNIKKSKTIGSYPRWNPHSSFLRIPALAIYPVSQGNLQTYAKRHKEHGQEQQFVDHTKSCPIWDPTMILAI